MNCCYSMTATGSKTTLYNVEDHGDANCNIDPSTDETEKQYLIKWKNWAHIHNTFESDSTLADQKVNGMKKLENYKKRENEIAQWYVMELG